ncbi:helicase SRCAP [Gouania willdenowi]|uniref:helicase SRCAP n=1 Tax=Gouania willdenowi TaxID=441366 RepID=UPI001056B8A7|nr:helicase SRCAP [Gouania willdenowi]
MVELSMSWPDTRPLSVTQDNQTELEVPNEKRWDCNAQTGTGAGFSEHVASCPASPQSGSAFKDPKEDSEPAELRVSQHGASNSVNTNDAPPPPPPSGAPPQTAKPCDAGVMLIKAEADQVLSELDAQQIMVLREDATWSDLDRSYFLQQDEGAVQGAVQEHVELDSQPVEVYEFCGLVEEVAEETICGSGGGGVHIPHSPGYEVNLFNALLENSDEFTIKEDLEGDTIIISQQHLSTPGDSSHIQPCSSGVGGVALAVERRLVLDSDSAAGICLVQVGGECFVTEAQTRTSESTVVQSVSNNDLMDAGASVTPAEPEPVLNPTSQITHMDSKQEVVCPPITEEHSKLLVHQMDDQVTDEVKDAPSPLTCMTQHSPHQDQDQEQDLIHNSQSKDLTPTSTSPPPTADPEEEEDDEEEEEDDEEDEEESEDQDLEEVQEENSAQLSSAEEEGSDEDEADQSETTTPSSQLKWIAERVGSSPVSPSPSSDWLRRDKPMLLRGPHGKFVSPSLVGSFSPASSPTDQSMSKQRGERHTDMAELAKHEADIEHRTQALKREGFWSTKRLTRLTEPQRPKVHWEYLCEEMQWLSADFAQERRWKRGVARKVVRMVMRHHEDLRQKEEKAKRDEHAKIRRVASSIAKEVRAFWSNVEKVVQYKQQSRLEEKRKKALDLQLDFIVGQTEKYSDLLTKSLAPTRPSEPAPTPLASQPPLADEDDRDFEPPCEEDDDEETIEVEEQQDGNDAESHRREIELLKEEGLLPLDQLLSTLKRPQNSDPEEEMAASAEEDEDREFKASDEDAEDEEDTIDAQEKVEGNVDHTEELDDLAKEGDMSIEELLEKYKGAYASDAEPPSASGSASRNASESEASGDEEVETDEDESDVESNSSSSESAGDSVEEEESANDEEEEECGDEGMEVLLKEGDHSPSSSGSRPKKEISHIAATAESLQPKGYTLATTKVKTPIPFLLHGTLREYQHIGLDWLVTMFEKKLNGILADEMGLGKTIQTIALLAHLACEKGNWGPHLIIVPTSVMLNWEMELKRWCPGFKILTYFGSQKERKLKRQGWTKPNAFHVCITSYKLVLQDHQAFRRKSWRYLILDEAQNIKNFKSQRWQSLLNFNSHRRLLLTGTPLQNSLMELWSLMHFLMPHVFQSHREFKEWFSNPLTGMIEGSQEYNEGLVKRLHKVLRPFLLRRIKADVEKQMPKKYEHVVRCRLSKRQRFLYDDFMAQASTRETLASGHFMSVINILMQLRKVCNHPNLFDPRPIQSAFITQPIVFLTASLVQDALDVPPLKRCDLSMFNLLALESRTSRYHTDVFLPRHKVSRQLIQEIVESPEPPPRPRPVRMKVNRMFQPPPKADARSVLLMNKPSSSAPTADKSPPFPPLPPPPASEVTAPSSSAPVVQQVVCSVAPTPPPPRPHIQTAVRSAGPRPLLTVRPPAAPGATAVPAHPSPTPSSVMPQRVLLSPDMQARLPSGEVVSIAQLASLAGRPVSSCQGSKPVTFQLQGNKLTLSGAQIHQVPAAAPRPVQGNVMHLVSSGVQHHIISQPAQVTIQGTANAHPSLSTSSTAAAAANQVSVNASSQGPAPMVSSPGVVKIVVRQTAGKEGAPVPTLAVAPFPRVIPQAPPSQHPPVKTTAPLQMAHRTPGPATAHYTLAPPRNPSRPLPPRPVLKVVQPPVLDQPAAALVTSTSSSSSSSSSSLSTSNSSTTPRDSNCDAQIPSSTKQKMAPGTKAKAPPPRRKVPPLPPRSPFYMQWLADAHRQQQDRHLDLIFSVNERRCSARPMYGRDVLDFLTFLPGPRPAPAAVTVAGAHWSRSGHSSCLLAQESSNHWLRSPAVGGAIQRVETRLELLSDIIDRFTFVIPPVEAPRLSMHCCHPPPSLRNRLTRFSSALANQVAPLTASLHRIQSRMRTQFPDLRLIQYDCGKLQTLHTLLRKLKTGGHRVLIFTQMTRMLDVLEQFLNYHGHIYLRLDGSTRVEQRQALMERFNADRRIFCFILSTRSGGVGVNLTGADTVVFYDSDWNPTMDAQAQDRCHRIGQTRDVHIYRLISERTVEENILKKANQKRMLGDMAIEGGNFTTAFFKEQTIRELFDVADGEKRDAAVELSVAPAEDEEGGNKASTTILEQALCRAEDEEDIVAASQAKAEQVAELAEFNENIPLDEGGEQEEVEELSKAEQEIAALVEQLTPIERYAMNFLEASLEDVCKEELKQAEEQVEAARKGLDQAKEGLKLHASSDDDDDFQSVPTSSESAQPPSARRGRKPKDKTVTSTRTSSRLRGASPEPESDSTTPRDIPERLRLRGRKTQSNRESSKSSKAPSPSRDHVKTRTQPNRSHHTTPVPSPPAAGKHLSPGESRADHDHTKDHGAMSPPSTSSRSPRKRQSADNEVLRGLVEDSPSAKVLRKLPGRLVTVVEEKEPRRRRRRGSGTGGGSSEENSEELNKDNTSPSPDGKTKTIALSQDQDSIPSPVHPPPVRNYPPYSPPHHSPDMPVLRNLPVRRRLETESRMAAQQQNLGRLKENQSKKTETPPGRDAMSNRALPSVKRKRGRPPKIPPVSHELDILVPPSPSSPCDEENRPLSPKRKRGRPPREQQNAEPKTEVMSPTVDSRTDEVSPTVDSKTEEVSPTVDSRTEEMSRTEEVSPTVDTITKEMSPTVDSRTDNVPLTVDMGIEEVPPTVDTQTMEMFPFVDTRTEEVSPTMDTRTEEVSPTVDTRTEEVSPTVDTRTEEVSPTVDMRTEEVSPTVDTRTEEVSPTVDSRTEEVSPTVDSRTEEVSPTVDSRTEEVSPTVDSRTDYVSPTMDRRIAKVSPTVDSKTEDASPTSAFQPDEASVQVPVSDESLSVLSLPLAAPGSSVSTCVSVPDVVPVPPASTVTTLSSTPVGPTSPEVTSEPKETELVQEVQASAATQSRSSCEPVTSVKPGQTDGTSLPQTQPSPSSLQPPPQQLPSSSTPAAQTCQDNHEPRPSDSASADKPKTETPTPPTAPPTSAPVSPSSQTVASPTATDTPVAPPPPTESTTAAPPPLGTNSQIIAFPQEFDVCAELCTSERNSSGAGAKSVPEMDVDTADERQDNSNAKRRKLESSSEVREDMGGAKEKLKPQAAEEPVKDQATQGQKRTISRQSSIESTCSSTPSSGCSSSTLTRYAHHKKTYENRHPAKRKREEVTVAASKDEKTDGEGRKQEGELPTLQSRRVSRSSSLSSSSESDESGAELRLTRSAKRQLQDQKKDEVGNSSTPSRSSRRNAGASTGGESGSDTSSVRTSRKSVGPPQEAKAHANSSPSLPPEPEVLGKRCSALNAAAKLLAMKGRVDTPGHTPRKDPAAKTVGTSDQKPQSRSVSASPLSNSKSSKNATPTPATPSPAARCGSRSTRQCPGSLLPPLELEYRRPKLEEKAASSSRGQSACSSMSSDGETDNGRRRSRSRSSSSSRRNRSLGSRSVARTGSRSGGTSSGSERDRSLERAGNRDNPQRRKDGGRVHKPPQEVPTSSSGNEGTPDRVLRSVAALAAVQARSPAASTRSSANQQRLNKT